METIRKGVDQKHNQQHKSSTFIQDDSVLLFLLQSGGMDMKAVEESSQSERGIHLVHDMSLNETRCHVDIHLTFLCPENVCLICWKC